MRLLVAIPIVLAVSTSMLTAQDHGPTVAAARAAVVMPTIGGGEAARLVDAPASCGSALKNAALLGLGLSLGTAVIELLYTLLREPFVRNGHDVPGADPTLIAWAGAAGFVGGLAGTAICRRRR